MNKRLTTTQKAERAAAAKKVLLQFITPQTRLYFIHTFTNRTGTVRHYLMLIPHNGEILNLSLAAANCCGFGPTKDGSIRVNGCGFSGENHIAYNLTQELFGAQSRLLQCSTL